MNPTPLLRKLVDQPSSVLIAANHIGAMIAGEEHHQHIVGGEVIQPVAPSVCGWKVEVGRGVSNLERERLGFHRLYTTPVSL